MGREDKASTFSVVPNDRVRGNMHKMKYKKFHLNPRKKSSAVRIITHWKRLLPAAVESPSSRIFTVQTNLY